MLPESARLASVRGKRRGLQLEPIAAFFAGCSHAAGRRVASGVSKEARGTMADGAPACECGEPDNDDVMIACSRSHAKCETAKCGGALWFHLHYAWAA